MSLKPTWDFTILAFSKNEFYGQHEQVLYIMKIQSFDQGDSASNTHVAADRAGWRSTWHRKDWVLRKKFKQ